MTDSIANLLRSLIINKVANQKILQFQINSFISGFNCLEIIK